MLEDKIALVTGGDTGIGKAIGLQMAKNRAKVAIASRSRSHLGKTTPIEIGRTGNPRASDSGEAKQGRHSAGSY